MATIGTYKNQPIIPGTQAQIQAQIAAINNQAVVPVVTNPVATPTVVQPTVGSIYGNIQPMQPSAYDNALASFGSSAQNAANQTFDENSIYNNTLARFQKENDAVNTIYAQKLNQAKQQGLNNLGSTTAIQARSGLLGSDFGASQTANVNQTNTDTYNGILAEQEAAIQAILGKGRQEAAQEIAAKNAARQKGATDYIAYLGQNEERQKVKAQNLASQLLFNNVDPSKTDITSLARSYGLSQGDAIAAYNTAKVAKDKADLENQINLLKAQPSINDKYGTGSIGEYNFYVEQEKAAGRTPITFSQYQTQDANRKAVIARAGNGAGGLSAAAINSTINQIAGSFDNEPIVKNYNVIKEAENFVNTLQGNDGSQDQALVFSLAKVLDPNSVVREGEYATAAKLSQSLAQSYGGSINQAINGTGFLSADARQKIKAVIKQRAAAAEQNYKNVATEYQRQIDDAASGKRRSITNYSAGYIQPQQSMLPSGTNSDPLGLFQ